jgi:hypothetical protein
MDRAAGPCPWPQSIDCRAVFELINMALSLVIFIFVPLFRVIIVIFIFMVIIVIVIIRAIIVIVESVTGGYVQYIESVLTEVVRVDIKVDESLDSTGQNQQPKGHCCGHPALLGNHD